MKFFLRTLFTLGLSALLSNTMFAQTYQWVNFGKSQGYEYGNDITTDDSGNVYVAGQFEYNTKFGNITINSAGQHDIFIAKYNSAGVQQWVRTAGGSDGDAGSAIGLDANGNVYVTGEFETTCKFSPTDSITSSGNNDIFLAKYSNDGVLQWVKKIGGSGDNRGRAIAVDAAGNSYFSGSFSGTANFSGQNQTSSGGNDIFIAKYNTSGSRVWVRKAGGNKDDRGRDITLDGAGNLYLTASYTQSANFSGTNISDATGSLYSAALVKYNNSGNLLWVRSIGGCCDTTRAYGPSVDEFNNVYFTGYFTNQVKFGSITLTGSGNTDAFIAKYDPNGNVLWAKKYAGIYEDFGNGSAVDQRRQLVYFTGMFDYRADFDTINVYSAGNRDMWLAAVDYSGNIQWLKTAGGPGRDAGYAVAVDTSGNIYPTGFCNDTANFGTYSVQGYPLADYYVTKISPAVQSEPTTSASLLNASLTNCTNVQLVWTPGSGANRIVVARASGAVNNLPADGNLYAANSTFGSGANLGNGNFVVYNGSGNSVTITGLATGVTYHFAVIEYNGYNVFTNYKTHNFPVANILTNSFSISASSSSSGICPGDSSVLTSSGAITYSWSPSSGLNTTSGSSVVARPSSTTTYTVTGTNNAGCQAANQVTISVLTPPSVTISTLTSKCINSPSFTLSGGTPGGGTYSGTGVSGGVFNPSIAGTGTHVISYTYTAANGCSSVASTNQVVNNLPSVSQTSFSSVCTSTPPFTLTGGSPSGGTYSGTGVSGNQFSPSVAGAGTHSITYTYTNVNSCTNSVSASITVIPPQTVTLASFNAVCLNTPSFALSGGSPSGGTYSGNGVSGGNFNPAVAGVGTHTITYATNGGTGCSGSSTATIEVLPLPAVSFSTIQDVCSNSPAFQLTGGSPVGGVYSGTGVSGGIFNPAVSGDGNFTLTYTYTSANTCANTAQRNVLVKPAPVVSFPSLASVCLNSSPFTLTGGSPVGGTYSGAGVGGNTFTPSAAGAGTHNISYNYIAANSCSSFATSPIVVIAPQTVTLSNFIPVCLNTPSFALSGGSPVGGTYSGPGVSGGMFNASSAGVGTHTLTYSINIGGGCSGSSTATIQVLPLPTVSLSSFADICSNGSLLVLSGGSPAGGVYSGTGVSAGTFNPASSGAGTFPILYTVTGANSCGNTATQNIVVNAAPSVSVNAISPVCVNASPFTLSGGSPAGGTWTGPGVSGSVFNPSVAGSGTHALVYTVTNASSCTASAGTNIVVNSPPVVTLAALGTTCINSAAYTLSGGLPLGGTYSGPGVNGSTFNPATAGLGTHTISYSYSGGAGCSGTATSTIQVVSQPTVNLSALPDVCSNAAPVTLTGGSPSGGVYSGSGVSLGQFSPAATGQGSFPITYTYSVSSTCSSSATKNITVKASPLVFHNSFTPVCVNSSSFILTGGSPVGGVYSGTGVSNGRFDPNVGVGNFPITYTIFDANGCSASTVQTMSVKPLPSVSINFFVPTCTNSGPISLNGGSPGGGNYSGTGVTSGLFNPAVGPGTYLITYTYSDLFGCSASASNPIQVNPAPTVQLNSFSDVCANESPFVLQGGTPGGGLYSGTGVSGGIFNPAVGSGTHSISYTYTDVNGCVDSKTKNILVKAVPSVDLGSDSLVCANASVVLNVGTGFSSVQWSTGSTASSIQIDSSSGGLGSRDISVRVTNSDGCANSDTITITFDACAGVSYTENTPPGLYLYPNPFSTTIRLLTERFVEVNVIDVSGRILESRSNVSGSVDLGRDLAAGTYFIQVRSGEFRKNFHVVKANR